VITEGAVVQMLVGCL